ncbi:g10643 [Coccomyxa viridis]|uniref:G10643 protein n=1 Tax=Coccomyxa viridis TaxID=1274662 RepID=A0ABP1GCW6_9CHLO
MGHLKVCMVLQGTQSSSTIAKVLANIVAHPAEAKYRKLRLANKRIQDTIVDVDLAWSSYRCDYCLQACGFELVFQEGSGEQLEASADLEGFAVLPEHADLAPLQAALQLLGHREPAQQPCSSSAGAASSHSASSSGAAGQASRAHSDSVTSAAPQRPATGNAAGAGQDAGKAAKRPRNTQVFFPAETSDQAAPPKWFFDQSPSQVKAAFLAKRKKTELDQTLMTRAYRDKLNGAKQDVNSIASATIRIRLPEGLVLQGEFNAGEPVSAVFEWLTDCLSDPGCTYELVDPDRKPVGVAAQSMRSAQLVPSALLNFRRLSSAPQQQPTLRQDILRLAK